MIYVDIMPAQPTIKVSYGEDGGATIKKTFPIRTGKNLGKKNATTPIDQAYKEAQGRFDKKLKSGYVMRLKDAEAGKVDKIIKGGVLPMLAEKYQDYKMDIEYPVIVQPKLDGQRCLAIKENGTITLWTRTRKPILSCPHIIEQLYLTLEGWDDIALDGELYHHDLKHEFEKLMSAVRKQFPTEESKKVQYHVYDCILQPSIGSSRSFNDRRTFLELLPDWSTHIKIVESLRVSTEAKIDLLACSFIEQGYEGVMVRNPRAAYLHKRTPALLKYKVWFDAEYKLLDVTPGEDDTILFHFKHKGEDFSATKTGVKKENQKYLKDKKKFLGKLVTVKWQKISGKNKVPMFANALRFREGEE